MPFFSVIIPTHNRKALLKRALESVWTQSFTDYEVIVVDDGSTDGTQEYLDGLRDRIGVYGQPNGGPGAARNLGIKHASGGRIAFLDSDDVWYPWTLAVHHEACARCSAPPSMSAGTGMMEAASEKMQPDVQQSLQVQEYGCFFDALDGVSLPIGGTPSITVSRDALQRVGGFCENRINGEDTDLWLRLGIEPGFARILQPPVFTQTLHDANITDDCTRAVAGMNFMFLQEETGKYPGAKKYRRKRVEALAATARSVSFHALRCGRRTEAARIYKRSFAWHLELRRLRYLAVFPMVAAGLLSVPGAAPRP